jgi:uncharacterized protein (DUF1697 family)
LREEFDRDGYAQRTPISFNYIRFPPHLQVSILDNTTREKYANDIEKYVMQWHRDNTPNKHVKFYLEEIDQVQRFCDYMRKDQTVGEKYRNNFVQFIVEYDKRRNKNFLNTFPEYELFWDMCEEQAINSNLIPVKEIE